MYQALYRKYRPRRFTDVAGQEHITETLRRQVAGDKLSHAYLFVGTRGTGKTTCAKILSRAVNCRSPVDGDPCNACDACVGIEGGSILDVQEIDAASNSGVDNVRSLREDAVYTPASVRKRVYIIDEVHMLSNSAFNALLKILEEPPEHLIFILATTELHKVPATILSRCQRYSFKRLEPAAIAARLGAIAEKEGFTLTPEAAEKLSALADGSMRDGISLLDQCAAGEAVDLRRVLDAIGLAGHAEIYEIGKAAILRDAPAALSIFQKLYDNGRDMAALLNEIAALMRDLLIFALSPDSGLKSGYYSRAELSALSGKTSPERLFSCLDIIRGAVMGLSGGGYAKAIAEMCLIRMCDERLSDDAAGLLARVARLEERPAPTGIAAKAPEPAEAGEGGEAAEARHAPEHAEIAEAPEPGEIAEAPEYVEIAEAPEYAEIAEAPDHLAVIAQMGMSPPPERQPANAEPTVAFGTAPASGPPGEACPLPEEPAYWLDILESLKSDFAAYTLLCDYSRIHAELKENLLMIKVEDANAIGLISSRTCTDPIKEAALKVLGRNVSVVVEAASGKAQPPGAGKLKSLEKYGIVKFE